MMSSAHDGRQRCSLNVIYASVSTPKQKTDLERQIDRLESFCSARGLKIDRVFSDIASGINFEKRKQFFELLDLIVDGHVKCVFVHDQRSSKPCWVWII